MSKPTKQIALGSLTLKLGDLGQPGVGKAEIAALEQDILRRQIDSARDKPDIAKAIRDALPKR